MAEDVRETSARNYEEVAAELEVAARHCRTTAQHVRDGAEVVGKPVEPGNAGVASELLHQLRAELGHPQDQHELGGVDLDPFAEPGREVTTGEAAEEAGPLEQVERLHPAAEALERAAALRRVRVQRVVERRHDQHRLLAHASTSAPRNCRS